MDNSNTPTGTPPATPPTTPQPTSAAPVTPPTTETPATPPPATPTAPETPTTPPPAEPGAQAPSSGLRKFLPFLGLALLLTAIPATIVMSLQSQDNRPNAKQVAQEALPTTMPSPTMAAKVSSDSATLVLGTVCRSTTSTASADPNATQKYMSATYTCADGTTGTVKQGASCLPEKVLQDMANKACADTKAKSATSSAKAKTTPAATESGAKKATNSATTQ